MIAISNLGEILITLGLDTITILLKMWLSLIILLTKLAKMGMLEFLRK